MLFLGFGLILLGAKYLEIGSVATWSWWVVLAPFGLAFVWWTLADYFGYSKKQAVKRDEARKQARIEKSRAAMGMLPRTRR